MSKSALTSRIRAIGIASLLTCAVVSSVSEAVLYIDPTRLVFDGRTRSGTLTFLNQNTETTTYRLFWRDMRQDKEGKFVLMKEGEDVPWSARQILRYSPRQVTLGPQESQIVRFALRKPKGLKEGEYRSHLVIAEQENASEDDGGDVNAPGPLSFQLNVAYSYSIPVVVVHGDLKSKVVFRDLRTRQVDGEEWELDAIIGNTGGASPMGIIRLEWEDDDGVHVVGEGGAHNVYLPQRERPIKVRYKKPETPGRLRIAYYDDRHAKRKTVELPSKELLAEAYLK